MKFGQLLKERHVTAWEGKYLQYKGLKKLIKKIVENEALGNTVASRTAETQFFHDLVEQMVSASTFYIEILKAERTRMEAAAPAIFQLRQKLFAAETAAMTALGVGGGAAAGRSRPLTEDPEACRVLKELAARLCKLRAVEQFGTLNREGVRKIMKKYDKKTGRGRQAEILAEMQRRRYFAAAALDSHESYYQTTKALFASAGDEVMQFLEAEIEVIEHPAPAPYVITVVPSDGSAGDLSAKETAGGADKSKAPQGFVAKHARPRNVGGLLLIVCGIYAMIIGLSLRPSSIETLVYLGVPVAFMMAIANGANDIANSMGTSVGAQALSLRNALLLGALFEFGGAMTMGQYVSKSIAKGVLEEEPFERQSGLFALAMFSVLVAATVTTLIATVYGYPISATHSIIGGLIATGLAAKGSDGLNGGGIAKTCIAWILSPLLGGLVAGVLYWLITKYVLLAKNPGLAADKAQYALFALTVSVAMSFILCKGPDGVKIEPYGKAVGVSIAIGVGSAFVYWLYRKKRPIGYGDAHSAVGGGGGYAAEEQVDAATTNEPALEQLQTTERFGGVGAVAETAIEGGADAEAEAEAEAEPETPGGLGVRSASYIHATTAAGGTAGGGQALEFVPGRSDHAHARAPSQLSSAKLIAHGMPFRLPSIGASESETRSASPVPPTVPDDDGSDTMSLSGDALEKAKADEEANRPFVPLLILSALSVAFAHGGNDVGNAVGPLGVVWEVYQDPSTVSGEPDTATWIVTIGSFGFAAGVLMLGSRTIETVGNKITMLTPPKSFSTQMGAAVAVLASSAFSMPVSTSHCLVGAVVGVGIAQKLASDEGGKINAKVLGKIVLGWVVTIPLAMVVAVIVYFIAEAQYLAYTSWPEVVDPCAEYNLTNLTDGDGSGDWSSGDGGEEDDVVFSMMGLNISNASACGQYLMNMSGGDDGM